MPRRYRWEHNYYPTARPKEVKDGIKAKSQRGDIGETWWSRRWISVLESFHMGARLGRGRSYARRGQVVSIEVGPGVVTAKVQGTRGRPYSVTIRLTPLSDEQWESATGAMASRAIFAAKLLSGEMPRNIEEAFDEAGMALLPTKVKDLRTDCSCPDWANPCKHIAAVYYLLAERFDEDPFLIFKLRGRTRDDMIAVLREKRAGAIGGRDPSLPDDAGAPVDATASVEVSIDGFWEAGEGLDRFAVHPSLLDGEDVVVQRLGTSPFVVRGRNLSTFLARAYDRAGPAAARRALEDEGVGTDAEDAMSDVTDPE